jgi:hypothetical protein
MGVEESVYLAKLAEQAERYEGEIMRNLVHFHANLLQKWSRT